MASSSLATTRKRVEMLVFGHHIPFHQLFAHPVNHGMGWFPELRFPFAFLAAQPHKTQNPFQIG
jgi:hypothetical protein